MDAEGIILAAEAWSREAYAPTARYCAVTTLAKREAFLSSVRELQAERDERGKQLAARKDICHSLEIRLAGQESKRGSLEHRLATVSSERVAAVQLLMDLARQAGENAYRDWFTDPTLPARHEFAKRVGDAASRARVLEQEAESLRRDRDSWRDRALKAEDALGPFARVAMSRGENSPPDERTFYSTRHGTVTHGHLRNAARVLAEAEGGSDA